MTKKLAYEIKKTVEDNNLSKQMLETTVNIRTSVRRVPLPENVMVFQKFAFLAATKLKPATNKILMLFFSNCAYENYIGMDIKTIADCLEITERSAISGLKELEENNIIIKTKNLTDARRHDYFINPIAAWRGHSYSRKQTISKLTGSDPNQLEMFREMTLNAEGKITAAEKPKAMRVNKDFDTPLLAME